MSTATMDSVENRLAGRLADRLANHVQSESLPAAAQVVSWLDLVDLCRELDEAIVWAKSSDSELLAVHGAVLKQAITCGEQMIEGVQERGAALEATGQTLPVLEASLRMLRHFYHMRHPEVSQAEVEAARKRIFDAAA